MAVDHVSSDELPLYPEDLAVCQRVFDALRQECGIEGDLEMCDLLAWHIITYYKIGLKSEAQLGHLARSTMDGAQRRSRLSTERGMHHDQGL